MQKGFIAKQNFIKDLTLVEHIILGSNIVLSVALFIVGVVVNKNINYGLPWLTLIAAIISIFATMAGVKKKALCPFLGIIGTSLLIPIAGANEVPATMIMYAINVVIQVASLITGIRNSDETASIKPRKIKLGEIAIYIGILVGLIALYTGVESLPGYNQVVKPDHSSASEPLDIRIFDSATLMFTLGCCLPMVMRLNFVGTMYILNDTAQLSLGICKIARNPTNMNLGIMGASVIGLLATSILGVVRGQQQSKNNKK